MYFTSGLSPETSTVYIGLPLLEPSSPNVALVCVSEAETKSL